MLSVVIPLYNKEQYIRQTLESVFSQTFKDFEVIVVDDGSTDGGVGVVGEFDDARLKVIKKTNGGVSSARNSGVAAAKGDWVFFLDADDFIYADCFDKLMAHTHDKGVDVVCGKYHLEKKDGAFTCPLRYSQSGVVSHNYRTLFLDGISLRTGACVIRKSILGDRPFDESLNRFEDMKAILELLGKSVVYRTTDVVMIYKYCETESLRESKKDNFEKDFIFGMTFSGKPFWEKCSLGKLLYLGWIGYPMRRKQLLFQYGFSFVFALIAKMYLVYKHGLQ